MIALVTSCRSRRREEAAVAGTVVHGDILEAVTAAGLLAAIRGNGIVEMQTRIPTREGGRVVCSGHILARREDVVGANTGNVTGKASEVSVIVGGTAHRLVSAEESLSRDESCEASRRHSGPGRKCPPHIERTSLGKPKSLLGSLR